ncbi:ATP-binding protein [Mariniflexile aquimaris]|uniref:histidine kinase n=1 Tax=Mariniflexile aquimaris TaxID=881009 RepID=A0ABW3BRV8_9FLAO
MKKLKILLFFFVIYFQAFGISKLALTQEKDSLYYYFSIAQKPDSALNLSKAYQFFNRKKDAFIKNHDTINAINHIRGLAIAQNELGDYYGCETTIVLGLKLLNGLKDSKFTNESKIALYNELGRIYMILLNYDDALSYFEKSLKITQNPIYINIIQNNMALVYIEQLDFIRAEKLLTEVYKNSLTQKDAEQTARALDNLGNVQSKLFRPVALDNLKKALNMRLAIKDNYGVYASYKNLKEYYKINNDLKKASFYANKAYQAAKNVNSASYIEDALSHIISLSSDPKVLEYKKVKDSITNAKQLADNKYALIKYNYLKSENEAKANELKYKDSQIKEQKERVNKTIYQSVAIIGLLLTIFLYFIIKSRHKKEKLQEVYITESRISKKVHDEVANDVYHIMTKLQGDNNVKERILDDLEQVYLKTRDISKENSIIDVQENYDALLKDLLQSYKSESINVITQNISKIEWNTLSDLKKITLFRVLQELMTNMRKHSKASLVALSFKTSGNKITIDYKDNGVGCNVVKHNGLQNAENRMASINGTITFESEPGNGFKVQITL